MRSMIRRVTVDSDHNEIIADDVKAEVGDNFSWTKKLPGAPRNIKTTFYAYIGGEKGDLSELIRVAAKPRPELPVPAAPSPEERREHELTHAKFAPWCQFCLAGRARGTLHHKKTTIDEACEIDYTYYSHQGFNYSKEERPGAACVATMVHRQSGAVCASVVLRKGVWPYMVELLVQFVRWIQKQTFRVRGDGEPALQQLIKVVSKQGVTILVESSPVGSHQSIVGAERYHDIVGGYVRTYGAQMTFNTKIVIEPGTRFFAWLLRNASFIVTHHHVHSTGVTAHFLLKGTESRIPLALFGERVLLKASADEVISKGRSRWSEAVWVGVSARDNSNIGLDNTGFINWLYHKQGDQATSGRQSLEC